MRGALRSPVRVITLVGGEFEKKHFYILGRAVDYGGMYVRERLTRL